jgi:protein phosphatase
VTRFDQIEHASLTDVGVRRSHNQDSHAVQLAHDEEQWQVRGHLFLVADGMGAHAVGEKASEQAAGLIPHTYHKYAQQGPASALRKAFVEANASIHACGQANREFEGMGTTTTALLLRPEGAWVGHVGDSRAYRIRDGRMEQLTYDHSLVWEYARLKGVDPEEVQDIPANVIHRCLGPEPLVQVDIEGPHPLQAGDVFLVCSDGLSGQVTDHEMGAVASVLPPAEACRFLVDLANLRGGPDNITALIVRVGSSATTNGPVPSPPPPPPAPPWYRQPQPWWVALLCFGSLLAGTAAGLQYYKLPGAPYCFVGGAAAIVAGLTGLMIYYRNERRRQQAEDEFPEPRIHRQTPCPIAPALIERLVKALQLLRERAEEKNWGPDWPEFELHNRAGEEAAGRGDLPKAFAELCRAMLPLSRAFNRQRQKEESFQPIWDRTPSPRSAAGPTDKQGDTIPPATSITPAPPQAREQRSPAPAEGPAPSESK